MRYKWMGKSAMGLATCLGLAFYYFKDVALAEDTENSRLQVVVWANRPTFRIHNYIYGVNFADPQAAQTQVYALNNWGGNWANRYHWQLNIANHAADWYFENISNQTSGSTPASYANFIEFSHNANMAVSMTVPIIGWLPSSTNFSCSYPVREYAHQQKSSTSNGQTCGNGIDAAGNFISVNDISAIATLTGPKLQGQWVSAISNRYGSASFGQGVDIYRLGNEPEWWFRVHYDVHPQATSYDEVWELGKTYAAAIKAANPNAKVSGPVPSDWQAYFYSAVDMAAGWTKNGNYWSNPVDRLRHQNIPFLAWYLHQMSDYEALYHQRLLNFLDIHAYVAPDAISNNHSDAATQALRIQSTAVLWDPNYSCTECTFFDGTVTTENNVVKLIPRMQALIQRHYPNTRLMISEYNWGGFNDISGAIAQADILGIFGVNRVAAAAGWIDTTTSSTAYYAFKMYRNYNGQGDHFLDYGVPTQSENRSKVAVYAAGDKKLAHLTLMVLNKTTQSQPLALYLKSFLPQDGIAVYQYTAAKLNDIVKLPSTLNSMASTNPKDAVVPFEAPAYSISLLELTRQK